MASPTTAGPPNVGVVLFLHHIHALRWLLPPMLCLGAVMGLPIALLPNLQADTFGDEKFLYAGLFGAAKGLLAMGVAPILGASSDRYGRKWPLFAIFVAMTTAPLLMSLTRDLWLYFTLDVFLSHFSGALSILLAAIADIIPDPKGDNAMGDSNAKGSQAHGMAVGIAAMGVGMGFGAVLGVHIEAVLAFRVVACLCMFSAIYCALALPDVLLPSPELFATVPGPEYGAFRSPEGSPGVAQPVPSLRPPPSRTSGTTEANAADGADAGEHSGLVVPSDAPHHGGHHHHHPRAPPPTIAPAATVWRALIDDVHRVLDAISQYPTLRCCFYIVLLDSLAEQTMVNLALLYLHDHLGFTDQDQVALVIVTGISGIVCLCAVIPYLTSVIGTVDALQVSLVANATSIGLYAFVTAKWQAIAIPVLCILGAGVFPCTSAIAATAVRSNEEGLAQGVTSGARMLAEGLSPFLLGMLFNAFRGTMLPGAPFLFASASVIAALYFTRFLVRRSGRSAGAYSPTVEDPRRAE